MSDIPINLAIMSLLYVTHCEMSQQNLTYVQPCKKSVLYVDQISYTWAPKCFVDICTYIRSVFEFKLAIFESSVYFQSSVPRKWF